MKSKVSASLLACNKEKIIDEVQSLENNGVDFVHFDVMDGKFVNNVSFNDDTFQKIRKYSSLPFEIHLMVENPLDYLDRYNFSQEDVLIVHYESFSDEESLISCLIKIKEHHKVGLTFKPKTDYLKVERLLKYLDYLLIMSVEPGFGGQSFLNDSLEKIAYFAKLKNQYHYQIEVDGGINDLTAQKCIISGADILVSGSYLFKENMKERVKLIKCEK